MATQPLPVVVNATITRHLREVEDSCMRNRVAFAMFKKKGRVKYNCSGKDTDWRVKYKIPSSQGYSDMEGVDYAVHEKFLVPALDWRARLATDAMSIMQKMMNKGAEAIVNHYATIMPDLEKSLTDGLSADLFIDGNAAANLKLPCGLETMFGTRTTPAAGDRIAEPGDTYADFATNLGDKGGTWTSDLGTGNYPNATLANDWPDGQGDYEYDYYSPKLVNWSSTGWDTGSTSWQDNAEYALSQTATWCVTSGGKDGALDMFLTTPRMLNQFKNSQRARQTINVQPTTSPLWALGFRDVMNLDGIDITSDYDVPANTCYGLNFDEMRMDSLNPQLFWNHAPTWDPRTLSDLFVIGFFGQFRFRPKHMAKLKNYA